MKQVLAIWKREESEGVLKAFSVEQLTRLILCSPQEIPVLDFRCWRDGHFRLNPNLFHGFAEVKGINPEGDIALDFYLSQAFDRVFSVGVDELKVVFSLAASKTGIPDYIQAVAFVPAVAHRSVVAHFNESEPNGYNSLIQFAKTMESSTNEQQNRASGDRLVEGTQERSESL